MANPDGTITTRSSPVHLESVHPSLVVPVSTANSANLPVSLSGSVLSTGNYLDTPLDANDTWKGEWVSIAGYSTITVNGGSDKAGTLYVDFSDAPDENSDGYRSVQLTDGLSGAWKFHVLGQTASYGRARVVNGTVAQGYVYLEMYLHPTVTLTVSRAAQVVDDFFDVLNVRELSDPRLDEANGKQDDRKVIQKFGLNPDVAASTTEDIWYGGGLYTGFLTAAATVRIKAGGNTNDTAAGSGAQSITIVGLDETWTETSENIVTNGSSVSSATTTTFVRIYRAYVGNVGTYGGANAGDITIETSGGVVVAVIAASMGQTQMCIYSVPANKRAFIRRLGVTAEANKATTVNFFQRQDADDVTTPYTGKRLFFSFAGLTGNASENFGSYIGPFPSHTDIWAQATGPTGGATISATMDIVLVTES